MNKMTLQEDSEELAVPELSSELRAQLDDDFDADRSSEPTHGEDFARLGLFERLRWFRDLKVTGKIHAIFGTFFAIGFAMTLVLGLGLTELWFRYTAYSQIQQAVVASTELRGVAGDLRYNTVRFIFAEEPGILDRQRESYQAADEQIDKVSDTVAEHLPQLQPRLERTRQDFQIYNSTFDQLRENLTREGRSQRSVELANTLSDQGDQLFQDADSFSKDLAVYGAQIEKRGIDYFFTMIAIVAVLALFAGAILLGGVSYLSRDFSRKIAEVTHGMTRLAKGDRNFEITGNERK
ncbi:MAG: hypothetical protein AAGE86_09965, partial [Pseudomonadota bacterium]